MTDHQSLTVLQALKHINQISSFRPYADDSIHRIRDIVRPAIERAEADLAVTSIMLESLKMLVAADNCNYLVETMRYEGYFDAARAAIAAATGETP